MQIRIDPSRVVQTTTTTITRRRELEPWCPKCGASEEHPYETDKILIRAYKVDDWSQCLVCSGHYNENLECTPQNHDDKKGWFR